MTKQSFLRKVDVIINTHYIPCPEADDCKDGKIIRQHDCWAHGYSDEGCPECHNLGHVEDTCNACDGTGMIPVQEDEGLEIFNPEPLIEAMRIVSNNQLIKEGRG